MFALSVGDMWGVPSYRPEDVVQRCPEGSGMAFLSFNPKLSFFLPQTLGLISHFVIKSEIIRHVRMERGLMLFNADMSVS